MMSVAIGPMSTLAKNQTRPLRFLLWASPALISASVPQPTKNSAGECCGAAAITVVVTAASRAHVNETFGAFRSVGSSILKSSAGRKPNMPAKITLGKVSRVVL